MYIKKYEIEHMRKKHPCLLDQINGYGLEPVYGGYDTTFDMSDGVFAAIIKAVSDAPAAPGGRE